MNVSFSWLAELANLPPDVTPVQLVERMTRSVVEVEGINSLGGGLDGVVVGRIVEIAKHPNADRLNVAQVDIGQPTEVTVVFGQIAPLKVGDMVPIAVAPCTLPSGTNIVASEIRGVASQGMVCLDEELGTSIGGTELDDLKNPGQKIHIKYFSATETKPGTPLAAALQRDDSVLEISSVSITNRPDLWGHYGLAREISALWSTPLAPLKTAKVAAGKGQSLKIELQTPLCRRYLGARLDNIVVTPSPAWLASRLQSIGIRPINNVVDVTNYVMAELGQPLHAFDATSLSDSRIVVKESVKDEPVITLDSKTRSIPAGSLLICNSSVPLAIAGIMGGQDSQISETTTSIILESANFEAQTIRHTATALGLRTEASVRFEKNLDPSLTELAIQRAIALLKQICPTCQLVAPITDVGEMKTNSVVVINTTTSFISERLGVTVPAADIATLLKPLGFGVKKGKGDSLIITVPSWRVNNDVSIAEDIVEEVGRRLGYDSIAPQLPLRPLSAPNTKYVTRLARQLKVALAGRFEFTEVNTYSFSLPSPLVTPGGLKLEKPPASHLIELRQSLIPNLIAVVAQNIRQQRELALFELGRVFRSGAGSYDVAPGSTKALPPQPRSLSLALTSPQSDAVALFRQLKGVVSQLLEQTGYQLEWIKLETAPAYAPWVDLSSIIGMTVQGELIGFVTVAPAEALASVKIRQPVAVAELDVTRLVKIVPAAFQYRPISRFPSIVEDVSLVIDQRVEWSEIKKFCAGYNPLISSVELFDVYEGSKVGASKRSLAFHVTFSSPERTLTAEEVQSIIKSLAADLTKKFKAEIR